MENIDVSLGQTSWTLPNGQTPAELENWMKATP